MTKILVIGYGNVLRRDDGAGIAAVEMLQQHTHCEDCLFVTHHQPYPETVTLIKDAAYVVFIDARIGGVPGEINALPVSIGQAENHDEVMAHHLTPEWLLWMTGKLYNHQPSALMFTITGQEFGVGEGLSDCVAQHLPYLVEQVEAYLTQILDEESQPVN